MSERATNRTEALILEDLPRVFAGGSDERWMAVKELRGKADDLAANDFIDDEAIRRIGQHNAESLDLDHEAADGVFEAVQKPAGGSLMAMHAPSRRIWVGTGTSIASTRSGEVVHYVNRPGEVEDRYGPGLPYIVDKLAWLAIGRDLKDYPQVYNGDGYKYVANRLNRIGRKGIRPHVGSISVRREGVYVGYRPESNTAKADEILVSASGTLPAEFHDRMYEIHMPSLIERAEADEVAGLFDGWEKNKRAGLYDIAFGEMIGQALFRGQINDRMLQLFDVPNRFADVDIN